MIKRKIGILLSIIATVFILTQISFNITGNVVSENSINSPYLFIIEIILLSMSFVLLITRKSLDAIIIPTGSPSANLERAKKAAERKDRLKDEGYYVISGYVAPNKEGKREYKGTQTDDIHKALIAEGINPAHIQIEPQSQSTIENVVYSLQKIKKLGGREVGIVSYPGHLNRFQSIIKKAKREGLIDNDFKVYKIRTGETPKEKVYELFEKVLNSYRLRHGVKKAMENDKNKSTNILRKIRDYVTDRF